MSDDVQEYDGKILKYKVLEPIDYFNQDGEVNGTHEIGEVIELPEEVGTKFVEEGKAEVVDEE
jgi:hypothetical protein